MPGSDRVRHCAQCARDVVDLSAHTALGARLRLAVSGRSPCVRYEARRDGTIRFRASRLGGLLLAAFSALAAPFAAATPAPVHLCSVSEGSPRVDLGSEPIPSAAGGLRVDIVDADDLTIPWVRVELRSADVGAEPVRGVTSADGRWSVEDLAPGVYAVVVDGEGFMGLTIEGVEVQPGARTTLRVVVSFASAEVMGAWVRPKFRWPRLRLGRRPTGDGRAHIVADPERWQRVAVRCEGSTLPLRGTLGDGEIWVGGLPEGRTCRARLVGEARSLVIAFTVGDASTEIEPPPPR